MTRPKSKRQDFGALLGRVFHIKLSLSKSMLFEPITEGEDSLALSAHLNRQQRIIFSPKHLHSFLLSK